MTKKVIILFILFILLGITLLLMIVLHVLSTFYSFTLFGLGEEQYKVLVSDAIFVLAFFVAMVPLVQVWRNTKKLREELQKEAGIKSVPIMEKGRDDLNWMLPHYKTANRIIVFAGGFGWLAVNSGIKSRLLELAKDNKLDLISYKNKEQVEEAFRRKNTQRLFAELQQCFRYESGLEGVICTMIQRSPTEWNFLYKSRPDEEGHAFNACVLSDKDSTRELLHILSELTEAEHWGKPTDDSSSTE